MSVYSRRSIFSCFNFVIAGLISQLWANSAVAAADPIAGRQVFQSQCSICHAAQADRNMIGPTLFGVVGRKSASVPGFRYSPADMGAHLTWDETTLDKYLQSPRAMIPGTRMTYAGLKDPTKRADLIAYLATLK